MSMDLSGGADPRLLGRESLDVRQPHQTKCGRKELEALEKEPAENKVDEVLQPAPGRLRAFVGGAWQRVQGIFRRSSSSGGGTEDDDEEPAVEAIVAENPQSQAATLPGDFRILPASAWQTLHARFCETKIEQETSEFSTAPTDAASEILRAEDADAAGLEMDMPVDPSPVFASTEASQSPESDWWLAFCIAVQQNLCCARVR